jgi:ATP-dependent HslUV protease, peptidase subunit HslV
VRRKTPFGQRDDSNSVSLLVKPLRMPLLRTGNLRNNGGIARSAVRSKSAMQFHATTILTVRHQGCVAMGGDGQVTLGNTIMKADAAKIRRLKDGAVLCGFAGASADAFALMERFETKLKDFPGNMPRAATELAKEWRMDRALRRLEALMVVADSKTTLLVSGTGDVIQPTDGIAGIGSGGNYAIAAARALIAHSSLPATEVVRRSLEIAADIDIYTNRNIAVEEMECAS